MEGHTLITKRTTDVWKSIIETTGASSVFEIGFNYGHSAKIVLEQGLRVHSIDICAHNHTYPALVDTAKEYDKFTYEMKSSLRCNPYHYINEFDLMFIDGGHTPRLLINDIRLANNIQVPYILIDDYHPRWFDWLIQVVDDTVSNKVIPYDIVQTYDYDSSGGVNTMILLKRK
jgi:hypothetical protein